MADIGDNTVFSPTDANNTSSTEPGYPEGMLRSRLNNAGRGLMGAVRRWWERGNAFQTATLSGSTYSVTYAGAAPAQYRDGEIFRIEVNQNNAGACSLNVNALGARNVKVMAGGELRDPVEREINILYPHEFVYNEANTCFILTNSSGGWSTPVRQTANVTYTTTSFVDSTILTIPVSAGAEYRIRGSFNCLVQSGGALMAVKWPGGTFVYCFSQTNGNGDIPINDVGSALTTASTITLLDTSSSLGDVFINVDVHVNSNAGNIVFAFAKKAAGGDLQVRRGSYLEVLRVQ